MENLFFNDEETAIMSDLKGLPEYDKIEILEDSLESETDPTGRRVLGSLISKLKEASRKSCV